MVSEVEAQRSNDDDHSEEKNLQGGSLIMAFWKRIDSVIIKKLVIFFVSYFGSRRKLTMPTMNIGLLVTSEERAPCSSLNKSRSVHRKGIIVEDLSFKFYDYWYL